MRVQARQALRLAQVTLAVQVEARTHLRQRHAQADRGEGILQLPPRAHVHVHVARGDERHGAARPECFQLRQVRAVPALAQQLDGDAQPPREARREPLELLGARRPRPGPTG